VGIKEILIRDSEPNRESGSRERRKRREKERKKEGSQRGGEKRKKTRIERKIEDGDGQLYSYRSCYYLFILWLLFVLLLFCFVFLLCLFVIRREEKRREGGDRGRIETR